MEALWRRKGVSHPVLVEPSRGRAGGEASISQEVGGARASQLQLLSRKPKSDPRAQKELTDNSLLLTDASVGIASNISEVATTFPLQSDLTGGSFNRGANGAFLVLVLFPPSHAFSKCHRGSHPRQP